MRETLRPLVAEFIGVFMLVFIGGGAMIINVYQPGAVPLGGVAAAQGLAYAIAVTATMNISGGHVNPAITAGLWSIGRIETRRAALYIVAQLLGAVVAAVVLRWIMPVSAGHTAMYGTLKVADDITIPGAILIEAFLTFFLAFAVMGTAVDPRAPKVGGFGIGLTLWMCILAGGPLTGAALNPARAFGPALVAGEWHAQFAYWIGPIVGSIIAMQVYERLLLRTDAA